MNLLLYRLGWKDIVIVSFRLGLWTLICWPMRTQKISYFTELSKHKMKLSGSHSDSDIWTSAKGQYIEAKYSPSWNVRHSIHKACHVLKKTPFRRRALTIGSGMLAFRVDIPWGPHNVCSSYVWCQSPNSRWKSTSCPAGGLWSCRPRLPGGLLRTNGQSCKPSSLAFGSWL